MVGEFEFEGSFALQLFLSFPRAGDWTAHWTAHGTGQG